MYSTRGDRAAHLEIHDVVLLQRTEHLDLAQRRLANDLVVVTLLRGAREGRRESRRSREEPGCKKNRDAPKTAKRAQIKVKGGEERSASHAHAERTPARRPPTTRNGTYENDDRGRKADGRTLNFFTATISPLSLLRHLSTTPYAPSPTTPTTSYLFILVNWDANKCAGPARP